MRARPPELPAGARAGAAKTKGPGLQLRAFRRSETAGRVPVAGLGGDQNMTRMPKRKYRGSIRRPSGT